MDFCGRTSDVGKGSVGTDNPWRNVTGATYKSGWKGEGEGNEFSVILCSYRMGKSEISYPYPLVGLYVTLLVCWHSAIERVTLRSTPYGARVNSLCNK